MKQWIQWGLIGFLGVLSGTLDAEAGNVQLDKAPVDLSDDASLQRGARLYMNYCSGCHSLQYVRYDGLSRDIGIVNEQGELLEEAIQKSLVFVGDKITSPILVSMPKADAATWFGVAPPDLSLVSRSRGADWLYTYLRSFYQDNTKTWGVNNLVFPDVAMPHVLLELQGIKELPDYPPGTVLTAEHLKTVHAGQLSDKEYDRAVGDLVTFLAYVGEPIGQKRKHLGAFVLLFLGIFLVFSYLLKREYWKKIK